MHHTDIIINVPQKHRKRVHKNLLLRLISAFAITSMVVPIVVMDAACSLYHAVYFRINHIPRIPRRAYIVIDRGRLRKLNLLQKWNCVYCDYANGLVAWIKAVVNTTEVYNCAIKHARTAHGQEHQAEYYPREEFC